MERCALFALILGACADESSGIGSAGAQSQTIAAASSGEAVYVIDEDHGAVNVFGADTVSIASVAVGLLPSRISRGADRVVVSLRGERAVAVLKEDGDRLTLEKKIDTGAEPVGVVVTPDGTKVYVAASLSGLVQELDLEGGAITREWKIEGEPRWLALHPARLALYVATAFGGVPMAIDLATSEVEPIELPELQGARFIAGENGGLATANFPLSRRLTGDPGVSPDGSRLLLPGIYIDNTTPAVTDEYVETSTNPFSLVNGYNFRVSPVVFQVPLDPSGRAISGRARAQPISRFVVAGTAATDVRAPHSYPSSVTVAPAGDYFVASFESSGGLVAASLWTGSTEVSGFALTSSGAGSVSGGGSYGGGSYGGGNTLTLPGRRPDDSANFRLEAFSIITDEGPRGAVFVGEGLVVDNFLSRGVVGVSAQDIRVALSGAPEEAIAAFRRMQVSRLFEVRPALEDSLYEKGRKLFYTANDGVVSGAGSAISCSTCHFEGRNDGLTWNFAGRGARQTPSLAGPINLTAPMGWEGGSGSVAEHALATSRYRMGGSGIQESDARAIEHFLNNSRDLDVPNKRSFAPEVQRGRAIFERGDVGCATCHSGQRLTDNLRYPMFGLEAVKTRSLVGIAASAPYLHDGSLATLRDVVLAARDGSMGDTRTLSDAEIDDLVAYLESL